jgi:hypothetical protein
MLINKLKDGDSGGHVMLSYEVEALASGKKNGQRI